MAVVNNLDRCLRGRILLDSDYVSDIASEMADQQSPSFYRSEFEEGLNFILSHFKEGFPRTIST